MARLRPGWLLVLCAVGLSISSWFPWLTTSALGGGRASAIGGTVGSITLPSRFGPGQLIVLLASALVVLGAMVARDLAPRPAAAVAVVISVSVVVLMWWYHDANVRPPVGAGYGRDVGAAFACGLLVCSVWALASALVNG